MSEKQVKKYKRLMGRYANKIYRDAYTHTTRIIKGKNIFARFSFCFMLFFSRNSQAYLTKHLMKRSK